MFIIFGVENISVLYDFLYVKLSKKSNATFISYDIFLCISLDNFNWISAISISNNTYSMKQPDLYYFETIKMTSQG